MDLNLQILDMAGAQPGHSAVIVNFVAAIRKDSYNSRLRNALNCAFRENMIQE